MLNIAKSYNENKDVDFSVNKYLIYLSKISIKNKRILRNTMKEKQRFKIFSITLSRGKSEINFSHAFAKIYLGI